MNRLIQNFFSIMYPFFPIWAWVMHFVSDKPVTFFMSIISLPLAFYFLVSSKKRLPKYLFFFILFTVYHVISSFINNTIPADQSKIIFLLYDYHIFACSLFIIIENTQFAESFIGKMNQYIFYIVILSLIVSVIQIKSPGFFVNDSFALDEVDQSGENEIRNPSIYSWYDPNSGGITFPIVIALALNFFEAQRSRFLLIIFSGIVVAFVGKARYIMISVLIAFSQLFFSRIKSLKKIMSLVIIFAGGVYLLIFIANQVGFDIQKIISGRILEEDSEMESAKARIVSYDVFMKKFPENPILGVGPATRSDVVELLGEGIPLIHVGYLSYLYFYGVVGSFFLFLTLFYLLRDSWSIGRKYKFWGSFYGLLTFCLANATFVYFNFAEMGIVLSVIYIRYYKSTYPLINDDDNHSHISYS